MSRKLHEKLAQLKHAEQRFDKNKISTPKIQRVPLMLRRNDRFMKYCTPKMISFGPIHHGSEILKEGEHYKLLWTSKFVTKYNENQDSDGVTQVLHKRIEDNMEELKKEFADEVILEAGKYDGNDLAWMLFVDGCSLLHFMENIDIQCPEALNLMLHQLLQIWRDTILLENQLPRRLLEMLSKKEGPKLEFLFSNHSDWGESKRCGTIDVIVQNPKPIHILDYIRSFYLNQQDDGDEDNNFQIDPNGRNWFTYKNVRDLKRAGIRMIPNLSAGNPYAWNDIHFKSKWFSGELRLPIFNFNDNTLYFFRNLIAYEMCPDARSKYEFCSFISFMDSLIDNAEDVKELRLSGVFSNLLGSDEDLANLFNELGDDLPTNNFSAWCLSNAVALSEKYIAVKQQIEKHYTTKWKTWLAEAYNTHFSTPWTIIAFFAALLIVNKYLENYQMALSGFEAAALKDPGLNAAEEVQKIVNLLDKVDNLLKGHVRARRMASLASSLVSVDLKSSYRRVTIDHLPEGPNRTLAVEGKVFFFVRSESVAPLYYLLCDSNQSCFVLSVHGVRTDLIKEGDQLILLDPYFRDVDLSWNEKHYQFKSIRLDFYEQVLVNGKALTPQQAVCTSIYAQHKP